MMRVKPSRLAASRCPFSQKRLSEWFVLKRGGEIISSHNLTSVDHLHLS